MAGVYAHLEAGWRVDDVSVNMERQVAARSVITPSGTWQVVFDAPADAPSYVAYVLCHDLDAQFQVANDAPANENYAYVVLDGERFAFYIPNGYNLYVRNLP